MRGVFLDRDGVINEDRADYVRSLDQFRYFQWTAQAFRVLARVGLPIVVVSNQSGIGRGYTTEQEVLRMHDQLRGDIASWGAHLASIEYCPHTPDDGCDCRKPAPGLFRRAAEQWDLELAGSYMVGDKPTDITSGQRLAMTTVRVATGYQGDDGDSVPDHRARDLLAAAELIASLEGVET